jgi:predicted nucleotidyltransferase
MKFLAPLFSALPNALGATFELSGAAADNTPPFGSPTLRPQPPAATNKFPPRDAENGSDRGQASWNGLSSDAMASATDRIASARLSESERRTIEHFASLLRDELGDDLRALWLYGSRARGEAHPGSDVDLLVIADGGRNRYRRIAGDLSEAAAIAEGESPFSFSVHTHDLQWLRGRRSIDSFFIQEVDRDKIVLAGGELD